MININASFMDQMESLISLIERTAIQSCHDTLTSFSLNFPIFRSIIASF
jgi:hypothetical protein